MSLSINTYLSNMALLIYMFTSIHVCLKRHVYASSDRYKNMYKYILKEPYSTDKYLSKETYEYEKRYEKRNTPLYTDISVEYCSFNVHVCIFPDVYASFDRCICRIMAFLIYMSTPLRMYIYMFLLKGISIEYGSFNIYAYISSDVYASFERCICRQIYLPFSKIGNPPGGGGVFRSTYRAAKMQRMPYPGKSPVIRGFFVERDLHLKASYASLLLIIYRVHLLARVVDDSRVPIVCGMYFVHAN